MITTQKIICNGLKIENFLEFIEIEDYYGFIAPMYTPSECILQKSFGEDKQLTVGYYARKYTRNKFYYVTITYYDNKKILHKRVIDIVRFMQYLFTLPISNHYKDSINILLRNMVIDTRSDHTVFDYILRGSTSCTYSNIAEYIEAISTYLTSYNRNFSFGFLYNAEYYQGNSLLKTVGDVLSIR